ncbi:F-box domain-containing protein [Mycena sanguinolenta]|uniref:F-box domain-containing protein n=1 Tax=Mycena sanguinolenta TaxID=230812 RepID=A0A8H6YRX1_9AGAR|nr:F-box domain-containing protein [Mycena sanguinolenta]
MSIFESHIHHTAELAIDGLFLFDPETMDEPDEAYPKLTFKPSVESLNASLLSTVVVNLPEGSEWDWIHAVCRATLRLTYLRTSHHSLDSFPLANLTQLEWLETAPMSEIFKIFEDAPNLRDIIISVDGPAVPSSESRLTMKSIAKIEISSDEHLGEFLEHSEFPNLVNLSICSADTWPGPAFHSFLSRSSCTLTVLEFNGCVISPEEIITCLQHSACKTLESLSLDGCFSEDVDVLLRYLTYQGPGPEHPPCNNPNLGSIILFGIYSTDGLLAEMVASRSFTSLPAKSLSKPATRLAPVRLRKVCFTFEDELTQKEDHAKDWKQLREIEKMEQSELKIGWPVGTNLPE